MEQIALRAKYRRGGSTGGYKSKHNDGTKRRATPRRKVSDKLKQEIRATQPLVTLALLPSGKRRFERRPAGDAA